MWGKTRDLIRSITKNLHYYDKKYMKIKFDSDNDLPLNKSIEIYNVEIVVRAIFLKITSIIHTFSYMNVCKIMKWKKQKIYSAKEKHLLVFYITNNKFKKFCINNIL